MKIYLHDKLLDRENAKISVLDRGLLFGDSVYETLRTYKNRAFLLDQHLDRLYNSAKLLYFKIPFTKDYIKNIVNKALTQLAWKETYIRIIITRGEATEISLEFKKAKSPNLIIIFDEFRELDPNLYEKGADIIIAKIRRNPAASFNPAIKSGNYLNNMLAYNEAKVQNAFDALLLNYEGFISEMSTSNIFFVKKDILFTPSLDVGILAGTTRNFILDIARENNIKFEEGFYNEKDIFDAEECFVSSTLKEILPVRTINKEKIFSLIPGKSTKKLIELFLKKINIYEFKRN
jgi:branched-chain amino acid aminotransferase